jgi:signal transduction histidine kinase
MSLRIRLIIFLFLFGTAVFTNFFALLYLAYSVSTTLASFEEIRNRQLLTVQMDVHLRDAEAALYRYQINGEDGFRIQFFEQLNSFSENLESYHLIAVDSQEQNWYSELEKAHEQVQHTGDELITLHDQQTVELEEFLDNQIQLADLLLNQANSTRQEDEAYQASIIDMQNASRAMLSSVTGYIALPDETKRVQFTDAVVSLRHAVDDYLSLAETETEKEIGRKITEIFSRMQTLGSRLIGQRDLQQSLYANFIALIFNAGQQIIVEQIEPHDALKFSAERQNLLKAVNNAIQISVLIVVVISVITILFMIYLTRQINERVDALLQGAGRVASGNLKDPVNLVGMDEFSRLAISFNVMMNELADRDVHLRSLIGKMAHIQDEERRLIGLDLHDGLTQLIISANMHLNTLNSLIGSRLNLEATQALDVGRTLVRQSIDEARKVIAELRPTVIEDFGLKEGLRRYVTEICDTQKWSNEIIIDVQEIDIPPAVQAALFRIIQEAMANIRKHAQTEKVRLILHSDNDSMFLRVQDWGKGFDPDAMVDDMDHLGLVSMQERAQMLGGTCLIQSVKGEGTTVTVNIPMTALTERSANVKG